MIDIVILISGFGSNLQAIIDNINNGNIQNARISCVISNKKDAYGLVRASNAGIVTYVVDHKKYADRLSFDKQLIETIDTHKPDLVVLAGFMRILTDTFARHYQGRLINIHPSLLPKYKGLNTHARAIQAHETEHGCTVHFVTQELDTGPVIAQRSLVINNNDTVATLQNRVHVLEHELYSFVIKKFAEHKITLKDNLVTIMN